jgi:hypothetical protein
VSLAALGAVAAFVAGPPPEVVEPTPGHPIVVGDRRISRGFLRHWADIASIASGGGDREGARLQAAGLLISMRWVVGEAAERGVVVTRAETTREVRVLRDDAFPRRRDYRRFLRRSGQTAADIRLRVRMGLFSDKLRALATAGAATPEEQQAQLDEFVVAFHQKWRARTACRPPWVTELDCGATSRGPETRRSRARALQASELPVPAAWRDRPCTEGCRRGAPTP